MSKEKSKLPFETLEAFIEALEDKMDESAEDSDTGEATQEDEDFERYLQFLKDLKEVYIPCSMCSTMIAPDELYNIENDEAVCMKCWEEENTP